MARRRTRKANYKKKKGNKRSRRRSLRKSRKKCGGKKRRKKRKKTRRRRKRQRGGNGCPYNKTLGEQITGVKYNANPGALPMPISTNNNNSIPLTYKQGGRKSRKKRRKGKKMKGGGWYDWGFSDILNGTWGGMDQPGRYKNVWAGRKNGPTSNPMDHPVMKKTAQIRHQIPDIASHHQRGVVTAANYGHVGEQATEASAPSA